MKKKKIALLALAVIFQFSVLVWEYASSVYPLYTGTKIEIEVTPVDPRSLFRGNYVRLHTALSRLPAKLYTDTLSLEKGEVVYVSLEEKGSAWVAVKIQRQPPTKGLFMRGRIWCSVFSNRSRSQSVIPIRYGIEAYFLPKKKALTMEKVFRQRRREGLPLAMATIFVSTSGKAALANVKLIAGKEATIGP